MPNSILIPKILLPSNEKQRWDYLYSYFSDQYITCNDMGDSWEITFDSLPSQEWYIDPNLKKGLDWWGLKDIKEIPSAYKLYDKGILSLNDSWTLYEWLRWYERSDTREFDKLTIIHLDEHDDMMSPHLLEKEGVLFDFFTNDSVDFKSESVFNAIMSSSIEIGSFVTLFLYFLSNKNIEVRHLGQKLYEDRDKKSYSIDVACSKKHELSPDYKRPECNFIEDNKIDSNITYKFFTSIQDAFDLDMNHPILLHIDMDYFCNRYEGCSNWAKKSNKHDPSLDEILVRIGLINEQINKLSSSIESTSIAFSPGFFPAEFWGISYNLLANNLRSCGLWGNNVKKPC